MAKSGREGGVNKSCFEQLSFLSMLPSASPCQNNSNDRRPGAIIPLARGEQWGRQKVCIDQLEKNQDAKVGGWTAN